jgi:hypothetical protein
MYKLTKSSMHGRRVFAFNEFPLSIKLVAPRPVAGLNPEPLNLEPLNRASFFNPHARLDAFFKVVLQGFYFRHKIRPFDNFGRRSAAGDHQLQAFRF